MFDQPCQRGHLPLNPETLTIGNKPVTISGDPSKQPNDNIKTKLKNISTTTTHEACGRASTTSQVLKGINIAASLPDKLNTFYARFEADTTAHTESAPTAAAEEVSPLSLSVADVTRSFKRVNIRPVALTPIFSKCFEKIVRNTSALCCLLHWTHYNLHTAVTVPQTMLLPSHCTLLSPTGK